MAQTLIKRIYFGGSTGDDIEIYAGTVHPEGALSAKQGSIYILTLTGQVNILQKGTNSGSTGWSGRLDLASGPTSSRPSVNLKAGQGYFDTTLGKPIWWKGSGWVDATGVTV